MLGNLRQIRLHGLLHHRVQEHRDFGIVRHRRIPTGIAFKFGIYLIYECRIEIDISHDLTVRSRKESRIQEGIIGIGMGFLLRLQIDLFPRHEMTFVIPNTMLNRFRTSLLPSRLDLDRLLLKRLRALSLGLTGPRPTGKALSSPIRDGTGRNRNDGHRGRLWLRLRLRFNAT